MIRACPRCSSPVELKALDRLSGEDKPLALRIEGMPAMKCAKGHATPVNRDFMLWLIQELKERAAGLPAGSVGAFLGAVLNFVIIALVLFLVVKAYNRMRAAKEEEGPPEDIQLLREIRDSLAGRSGS